MGFRGFAAGVAALAGVLAAGPAAAEWLEATSPHFRIYANAPEREVRQRAIDLERFDMALRKFQNIADSEESRAAKVAVYVVRNEVAIQQLCRCNSVAGMYRATVAGAAAFTPRQGSGSELKPRIVLFHEYAHHFLLGSYPLAFPAWFSEGFAEFVSTAKLQKDAVVLGNAAQHRGYVLDQSSALTAEQLFDPTSVKQMSEEQVMSLYARGWLLSHYLLVDRGRYAQLQAYVRAVNTGTPSLAAARAAFGDLKALDATLNIYARKPLDALRFAGIVVPDAAITVRPVSPGAGALMELRIRSIYGVDEKTAGALFAEAQPIAARFPDDAVAQGWLAEMALDAGKPEQARAAADRALARDPAQIQALLYKARVLTDGKDPSPAAIAEARALIVRANRTDSNDAAALWHYYESFLIAGAQPTKAAIAGLYRAADLVPQDRGVRMTAAMQMVRDDDMIGARRMLRPIAFSPHAPADNAAARIIAAIDAGQPRAAVLAAGSRPAKDGPGAASASED